MTELGPVRGWEKERGRGWVGRTRVEGIKRALTIQHVDHYAGWIRVAGNAGVISAVGQSGLCHQKSARRSAFRLLRVQGNPAPTVNAELSKILCFCSSHTRAYTL